MNFLLVIIAVSISFGGVSYIASGNLISSLCISLFSIVSLIFLVKLPLDRYHHKIHRYHQCYQFINSYLISLSVKGSMSAALQSGYEIADTGTREIIDSIKDLNEEEKVTYLHKYFKFDLYRLFVDTISLWNEEGGDILEMSQHLINQVRLKEEYLLACQNLTRSKVLEFVILWTIALAILGALRFALSQFFYRISQTIFYQIAIIVLFLFVIASIYILIKRITNVSLEGWKEDEK